MIYDYKGLTSAQVEESRQKHGANVYTPPVKESLWKRFFMTLTGPFGHFIKKDENGDMLVFILECAAVLSICISLSEYNGWMGLPVSPDGAKVFFEPVGIIMAILLASGVGFIAEVKAEKEFEVLNQVNDDESVTVVRDGKPTQVPRKDIVVGDIISITTGEEIPADAQILEATQLSVDESTLTGEPMTHKSVEAINNDTPYPTNKIYKGTKVLEGSAIAEVFAVGDTTENGKVFEATKLDDGKKTPLDQQFEYLGYLITAISAVVGVLVFVGRIVFYLHSFGVPTELLQGPAIAYLLQSLMIAVTLVVCAVPEGLPMAVTMALAYSMRKMLKTNNLVRKLHACETMGATTVICTDKTGTLTQNRMRVTTTPYPSLGGEANMALYLNMAINSTAELDGEEVLGNPTEGALLLWLKEQGIDYKELRAKTKVVSVEPFSTETKMMKTTLADGTVLIKGAPEYVMALCSPPTPKGGALNWNEWDEINAKLKEWQGKAMRTLAFAYKDSSPRGRLGGVAIVGIFDPVREDVPEAIKECQRAGIRIIMVTGDSYNTAHEIGRQIGLANLDTDVISRARPMDKKELVERLQAEGEVVAVTGDGTNDAPAMKAANVGLSMGSGTSVAKEASDITIIDDSFSSIVNAVVWGRSLYINIQRFILFQLTVNISACLIVMIGSFIAPDSPLTVTQMLWVNLIMDTFAAVALASLPPSKSVMNHPPRRKADRIINLSMATDIIGTGFYFTALLLTLLFHLNKDGDFSLTDKGVFFTCFVLLQLWNLFLAKDFRADGHTKAGLAFWGIAAAVFFGQLFIVNIGYNFFNIEAMDIVTVLITIGLTLLAILPKILCIHVLRFVKSR